MSKLSLQAQKRDLAVKAKNLRKQKIIPAVCYGQEMEPMVLQIDYQSFRKVFNEASTTQVVYLNIDSNEIPVLVHDVSHNPLTNFFDHVDFLKVNLKETVDATVPIELSGVCAPVKNLGATVSHVKHEISVRCLPMDIPHEITIDLTKLENIGEAVHVKDLNLGSKVEILDNLEDLIVVIVPPKEYTEENADLPDELKQEANEAAEKAAAEKAATEKKD